MNWFVARCWKHYYRRDLAYSGRLEFDRIPVSSQAIMTLKGMRKADQQMILDTLGMDRVPATTRSETTGTSGPAPPAVDAVPVGAARLTANIPNFETNTRWVK